MNQDFEQRSPSPLPQKLDANSPPQWRDLWAAVLFYIQLFAVIAVGSYAVYKAWGRIFDNEVYSGIGERIAAVLWQLAGCLALTTVLVVIALHVFRHYPTEAIHGSFLGQIGLYVAVLLYLAFHTPNLEEARDMVGITIIILAMLLTITIFYFLFRDRIPFSAAILGLVNGTISTYPRVLFLSLYGAVALFVTLVAYLFIGMVCVGLGGYFATGTTLAVASLLWTVGVINNVFYTTTAGIFATAYFTGSGQKVEHATSSSFHRAITYSFGSICLGSLIVAAIQFAKLLVSAFRKNSLGRLIVEHLLSIVEELAAYFNSFAYIEIAIYGKPFCQAGKDVWSLIKRRGVDAVINDSIIGTACFMASLTVGLINYIVIALMSQSILAISAQQAFAYATLYFTLALLLSHLVLTPLVTGARTMFVCLAEDPAALQRNDPAVYNMITSKYGNLML